MCVFGWVFIFGMNFFLLGVVVVGLCLGFNNVKIDGLEFFVVFVIFIFLFFGVVMIFNLIFFYV